MAEKSFMTVEEGNRIKGIKVQNLLGCKGIEHRIAETRVYDSSGACKYYFLS